MSRGLYLALPIEVEFNQPKDQLKYKIILIPLQFHGWRKSCWPENGNEHLVASLGNLCHRKASADKSDLHVQTETEDKVTPFLAWIHQQINQLISQWFFVCSTLMAFHYMSVKPCYLPYFITDYPELKNRMMFLSSPERIRQKNLSRDVIEKSVTGYDRKTS